MLSGHARGRVHGLEVRHEVRAEAGEAGVDHCEPGLACWVKVGAAVLKLAQKVGTQPLLNRAVRLNRADRRTPVGTLAELVSELSGATLRAFRGVIPVAAERRRV